MALAVSVAAGIAAISPEVSQADPLTGMPDTYFPIGVFYQPASPYGTTSFTGWKARGINTLVGYENQGLDAQGNPAVTIDQWSQAAVNAGLYMIRQPRENIADDVSQPNLIAYLQPDEPDGRGIAPAVLQANYANWTAAGGGKPVAANFDGSRILGWQGTLKQADYVDYSLGADWVAQDIYPVTGWNAPNKLNAVGQATATLRQWSNKPTFAFIETSNQRLFAGTNPEWGERGPTPGEMRFEIWDAVVNGARGIMYFPQSFNGFRFDATPPDVAAEMTRQNTILSSLAPVLNATNDTDKTGLSYANGKIEGMFRTYNGVQYLILLNATGTAITVSYPSDLVPADSTLQVLGEGRDLVPSDGSYTDDFDPFGVHIYAVVPLGAEALAIPEPAGMTIAMVGGLALLSRRRRNRA